MTRLTDMIVQHADQWTYLVWHAAWQGALVGIVALVVVALRRRWPAPLRYWILVLALVKFATPSLTALPTGIFGYVTVSGPSLVSSSAADIVPPTLASQTLTTLSAGAESLPDPSAQPEARVAVPNQFADQQEPRAKRVAATISPKIATAPMPLSWTSLLMLSHLAGTALFLALCVLRALRLQGSCRRMQPPSASLVESMTSLARRLGLWRIPALRVSQDALIPYSTGAFRPVVVIPARIIEQLSAAELQAVLYHELAHHRRGDLWLNWLQLAISAAWWFHPVVWLLNRAIRTVREECCDDLLLSRKFVTDVDYCTTLVRVAGACDRRRPRSLVVAVSMLDDPHPLTGRIRRIMDESLPRRERPGALAVLGLFALAAVVLPGVRAAPAPIFNTSLSATGAMTRPAPDPHAGVVSAGKRTRPMRIRVVDIHDRPVASARVSLRIETDESQQETNQQTGLDGTTVLEIPQTIAKLLHIRVNAEPFVALNARWRPQFEPADLPPEEFQFRLVPGRTAGGKIVDEQNQPVSGAVVALMVELKRDRVLPDHVFETKTDDDGTWSISRLPADTRLAGMQYKHPGSVGMWPFALDGKANAELNASKYERILQTGVTIFGRVTDHEGQPVVGATVALGQLNNTFLSASTLKSAADGTYRLTHCPVEDSLLTIFKVGLAPHLQMIAVGKADGEFNARLLPGRSLRLRVTDNDGQPVFKATVSPYRWPDTEGLTRLHNFGHTNKDGIWSWDWAPDEELPYMIFKEGYVRIKNLQFRPGAQLREVQLQPELQVRINVVDDATSRPIPEFRATLGLVHEPAAGAANENLASRAEQWMPTHAVASPAGEFVLRHGDFPRRNYVVRIDAEGYHSAKSRIYRADEEDAVIDVRLVATGRQEAVVLNMDGTPAAGAEVLVGTASNPVSIRENQPDRSNRVAVSQTDRAGRVRIDARADDFTVFVLGTSGFARVPRTEFDGAVDEPVTIVLKPWARVEGTMRNRQTTLAAELIQLNLAGVWGNSPRSGLHAQYNLQTKSDANGRFVFDRVPSDVDVVVAHHVAVRTERGPFFANGKSAQFKAPPGQVRTIVLGGTGRTVIGRFQLKDEAWAADWEGSLGALHLAEKPAEADVQYYWPSPRFDIDRDGSFRIEDVPPGPYRIAFALLALKPESTLRSGPKALPREAKGMRGLLVGNITVSELEAGAADQPIDAGTLPVGYANSQAR
jgi:beta-lactamase regulating signal transducer with metallopeptidase domain/protocatechuate 3,4-dioxygenase beta subunit